MTKPSLVLAVWEVTYVFSLRVSQMANGCFYCVNRFIFYLKLAVCECSKLTLS